MPISKAARRNMEQRRINIEQAYEVKYWTQEFGVSPDELEEAVQVAGDHAAQVRAHLQRAEHN